MIVSASNPIKDTSDVTSISANRDASFKRNGLLVRDPKTYSALIFAPQDPKETKPPLLVVLHGAGRNNRDAWDLADPRGEHRGLPPSLLSMGSAPSELAQNFVVVAPYSAGRPSFYDEPRNKLLEFVAWCCSDQGHAAGIPDFDPHRVFIFGFSDGATVAVELLTSGRFAGGIVCAYGFTGVLPGLALKRLAGCPLWVFHSADDAIFPVEASDRLVAALRNASSSHSDGDNSNNADEIVRYTRFKEDQEGFTGAVKGHSTGITASRTPEIYKWMLALPPASVGWGTVGAG